MSETKYLEMPWSMEDTIENLKELKEVLSEQCIITNLHGKGEKDAEEVAFDFDRAIVALEKQIPKKPIEHERKVGFPFYECPICGECDVYAQEHCDNCGQKLDWSE